MTAKTQRLLPGRYNPAALQPRGVARLVLTEHLLRGVARPGRRAWWRRLAPARSTYPAGRRTGQYDRIVRPGADDKPLSRLPRWAAPQDGYESQLKPDWRERRRRPLRRREVAWLRAIWMLELAGCIIALAAGPPAPSLWHAAAIGLAISAVAYPATIPRHCLLQLFGLRPPADRDN